MLRAPRSLLRQARNHRAWWPDHTVIPGTDAVSRAILDRAVACLILVRGGDPHDPGAVISTLVSLIADADDRLPDAVAGARAHGYTWNRLPSGVHHLRVTPPVRRLRPACTSARSVRLTGLYVHDAVGDSYADSVVGLFTTPNAFITSVAACSSSVAGNRWH